MPLAKLESQASSLAEGQNVLGKQQVKYEPDSQDDVMLRELEERFKKIYIYSDTLPLKHLHSNLSCIGGTIELIISFFYRGAALAP